LPPQASNYEDIKEWGERMAVTTITSKAGIFFASDKRSPTILIHVFETFQRVGKQSGTGRSDEYEVTLASWLLDNLTLLNVYVRRFAPYKKLRRPIARHIRPIALVVLASAMATPLKIINSSASSSGSRLPAALQDKTFPSEALDELISVRLSGSLGFQLMSSKIGYKGHALAGGTYSRSPPSQRAEAPACTRMCKPSPALHATDDAETDKAWSNGGRTGAGRTLTFGIAPHKAENSSRNTMLQYPRLVEYVPLWATAEERSHSDPPGCLDLLPVRDDVPIQADFCHLQKAAHRPRQHDVEIAEQRHDLCRLELEFDTWRAQKVDDEIGRTFSRPTDTSNDRRNCRAKVQRGDKYFMRICSRRAPGRSAAGLGERGSRTNGIAIL